MSDKNSKDSFNRVTNPDGTPVRDKDNADPKPKPQMAYSRPAPNLAPAGTMGIRQTPQIEPVRQKIDFRASQYALVPKRSDAGLSIDRDKSETNQWISGKITTMPGYSFHAKMYDDQSKHGIEGGQISKLDVLKDDQLVMRFDRGWDTKPSNPEHVEALDRIRSGLGDTPEKTITAPDRGDSKDQDHQR
ncbi:DUF7678 domain-containing protein [Sulfitobacter pacificus]|uniref:DUF7678 domain-containing protein n=1 Tax=Sulfitobacter pacificus TaxID=1499314 RepID=UPI0031047E59